MNADFVQRDDDPLDAPGVIAQEIYDALDGLNNVEWLFTAMQGHDETTRTAVRARFRELYPDEGSLATYLNDQLDDDNLVKAFALLSASNTHGYETALALALIPSDTRDAELWRILEGFDVAGRQRLEERYNTFFGKAGWHANYISAGTLKDDLDGDLSGDDQYKAHALLDRQLTDADRIYMHSGAIVGTNDESIIQILQAAWDAGGPKAIKKIEDDWNRYVRRLGNTWTTHEWTDETLYQELDSETSGEDWKLIKAILVQTLRAEQAGLMDVEESSMTEAQRLQREDIELSLAWATLHAAADGAGTNEAQVYRAVPTISQVWRDRVARAAAAGDDALAGRYRQSLENAKSRAAAIIRDQMDAGWGEREKALILLEGNLTPADELYVADLELDNDKCLDAVDKAWAEGKVSELKRQARVARTNASGVVVRPPFEPLYTIPITSGMPWRRLQTIVDGPSGGAHAGASRMKLELDEGTSNSDLERAFKFVSNSRVPETLRSDTIEAYGNRYVSAVEGETGTEKFLTHIAERYNRSNAYWEFLDVADAVTDQSNPAEYLRRAKGRWDASNSGALNGVLNYFVRIGDDLTGEDSLATAEESLARLGHLVNQTDATSPEIEAMLAITGKTRLEELASVEYGQFKSRLADVRRMQQTVAEALATAVELAVEAALTVATGGAAGGALLSSLAATVAGMLAREALLGDDYDLLSSQNAAAFAVALASPAFGQLGRTAFGAVDPTDFQRLSRAEQFMSQATEAALTNLGGDMVSNAVQNKMEIPSAEDIIARVLTIGGGVLSRRVGRRVERQLADDTPLIERIRAEASKAISEEVTQAVADEAAAIAQAGAGDLTGVDLALRFGRRVSTAAGRGLSNGVRDASATHVGIARERRRAAAIDDPEQERADGPNPDPDDITDQAGTDGQRSDDEMQRDAEFAIIGPVDAQTLADLENDDRLRRAWFDNPGALEILKKCGSRCLPDAATPADIERMESILDSMEAVGMPARDDRYIEQLRSWFHHPDQRGSIARAIDRLDVAFQIGKLDGIVDQLSIVDHPTPERLAIAAEAIESGAGSQADLEVLLTKAVADARSFMLSNVDSEGAQTDVALTPQTLKGLCGPGRDISAEALLSLTAGPASGAITVRRYQAGHLVTDAKHGFTVVEAPTGTMYLVDPTFGQFLLSGSVGDVERVSQSSAAGADFVRRLMTDGFVELDAQTAQLYGMAMGPDPDEAAGLATSLLGGAQAMIEESVADGIVSRFTGIGPEEADQIDILSADPAMEPGFLITELTERLVYLDRESPQYLALLDLRDRLRAHAASLQNAPLVTAEDMEDPALRRSR